VVRAAPLARTLAALVFVLATVLACNSASGEPPRPAAVPKQALWIGGADGGAFVLLRKDPSDPAHVFHARVFHAHGEPWFTGALALPADDKGAVDIGRREAFAGWDGEKLILADGRTLRPLRAAR
jgi:hypothetical protein